MPRIRSIKPEITSDRKLASVSLEARLTFIYTWTIADDDGFFRAEDRQLLGALFPHDSRVTLETLYGWLEELVGVGVLRWRTTQDGARVGEIVNWTKHQKICNRSEPFLAKHLQPLTASSCARVQRGSREPLEGLKRDSIPEPRVQSLDHKHRDAARRAVMDTTITTGEPPSSEQRATRAPDPETPDARARTTWLTPYFDAWVAAYGGKPSGGKLSKFLKPLHDAHGPETTLSYWRNYLVSTEAPYASPAKFAATFGSWAEPRPNGKRDPRDARPGETADEYLARMTGGARA